MKLRKKFRSKEDQFLMELGKLIEANENRPSVPNEKRLAELDFACELVKSSVDGDKVTVTLSKHDPYPSVGCIGIEGTYLEFTNPEPFQQAIGLSDNVEVYPTTKGTVVMNLTFYHLVTFLRG